MEIGSPCYCRLDLSDSRRNGGDSTHDSGLWSRVKPNGSGYGCVGAKKRAAKMAALSQQGGVNRLERIQSGVGRMTGRTLMILYIRS